ncbi:AhpC/TSA family protein [Flavobacteriaceae bacterium S0825]|uniref:peroxiredoxin-like family protein n=1 Tax=Gaetbulibacter sp. S0825 TaxID=2720084 RepID=UPI00143199EE|nr:peroxiredoxin-like family protein [Gaetbulibacter sp. S0825]MCK0109345.1 AhpC/TSA family protein [Flavobacteriaceae bacterium S0825]NIX64979.1 AhpC/TSA family protein [Gaetbulibacter sp. S0825]
MTKVKSIQLLLLFLFVSAIGNAQLPQNAEDISPLLIGETLPEATLLDENGKSINLNAEIAKKKTVLVFYRGGWCPYCNMQLSSLAATEKEILELGYQIIAVSPDDYRNLKPSVEKNKTSYKLYSDADGSFIKNIGIGFTPSEGTTSYIAKKTTGKTTDVLPVPTVLVLNTKGEILFEYISPNYKQRISPELLLAVLQNVK